MKVEKEERKEILLVVKSIEAKNPRGEEIMSKKKKKEVLMVARLTPILIAVCLLSDAIRPSHCTLCSVVLFT